MQAKYISGPETSKMLKQALKSAFPGVTFSVRYKSYSGGSSISIHYKDGPTTKRVEAITDQFERCGFDGMQDLKTYLPPCDLNGELVTFGADYISVSRSDSWETLKLAALEVALQCDLPLLEITKSDGGPWSSPCVKDGNYLTDWHYRDGIFSCDPRHVCMPTESHAELIYRYARSIDLCEQVEVAVPSRITQEFIDSKVSGLLQ